MEGSHLYNSQDEWVQDRVGCYWTRGQWRISTFAEICGGRVTRCGYRLLHKAIPLEDFTLLADAKLMAADLIAQRGTV